jgi:micrococcal nuclease
MIIIFIISIFLSFYVVYFSYNLIRYRKRIKCNINSKGERIYHMPSDRLYNSVKIDYSKGEMYVLTETEALTEGFRRSKIK